MSNKPKIRKLKKIINDYQNVIIAYSGGVDSTFLLNVCVDVLGTENIIAVTAVSDSYTTDELKYAKSICKMLRVKHIIVETDEMSDSYFINNTPNRCYHCKKHLYAQLREIARIRNIKHILDASNTDDKKDYRPGRRAAKEFLVKSPLIEAGLTKKNIRVYSKALKLDSWNKPANACLASRIPYGRGITKDKLKTVGKAEAFLKKEGLNIVRLRHHGDIARIEVSEKEISKLMEKDRRRRVFKYLKGLGFHWVTVDLEGYRTGSLNEVLPEEFG